MLQALVDSFSSGPAVNVHTRIVFAICDGEQLERVRVWVCRMGLQVGFWCSLGLGQRLQQGVVKGGTSSDAKPVDGGLEIGEIKFKLGVSLGLNRGGGGV
jgi:hypothetical protein